MTYRLAVTGSREYDDGMSLRAALDQIFDEVPSSDLLVVMCALHDDPVYQHGADVIAAEWGLLPEGLRRHQRLHGKDLLGNRMAFQHLHRPGVGNAHPLAGRCRLRFRIGRGRPQKVRDSCR